MKKYAFIIVFSFLFCSLGIIANANNGKHLGPPGPGFWVDGQVYRTVGTPTMLPDQGPKDGIYTFTNLAGQMNVAEAKPGDMDYNGGRWQVYKLAFTEEGLAVHDPDGDGVANFQLKSWEEVQTHIGLGHLEIVGMGPTFECPVIP